MHSNSASLFTQYHLDAIQPPATFLTRPEGGSSSFDFLFFLVHLIRLGTPKPCTLHKQIVPNYHKIFSTRSGIQMTGVSTHPSPRTQESAPLFCPGKMCSQIRENTTPQFIYNSIVVDLCPTTCTRACLSILPHNCIPFAFAHNGAL